MASTTSSPSPSIPDGPTAASAVSAVAPADVLRQVRRIELRTRRLVDSSFAGEYRSLFKGEGRAIVLQGAVAFVGGLSFQMNGSDLKHGEW